MIPTPMTPMPPLTPLDEAPQETAAVGGDATPVKIGRVSLFMAG